MLNFLNLKRGACAPKQPEALRRRLGELLRLTLEDAETWIPELSPAERLRLLHELLPWLLTKPADPARDETPRYVLRLTADERLAALEDADPEGRAAPGETPPPGDGRES